MFNYNEDSYNDDDGQSASVIDFIVILLIKSQVTTSNDIHLLCPLHHSTRSQRLELDLMNVNVC